MRLEVAASTELRFTSRSSSPRWERLAGPALWACALGALPNRKFAATEAVYQETGLASAGLDAHALTLLNVEHVYRYYATFAQLLIASRRRALQRTITATGEHEIRSALSEGQGCIIVTAHVGDFELAGSWLAENLGVDVVAIVNPMSSRLRDWAFRTVRRRAGLTLRDVGSTTFDQLADDVDRGRVVTLMLDRRQPCRALPVSFLGARAEVSAAPWLLARRTRSPVFVAAVRRVSPRRLLQIRGPFTWDRALGGWEFTQTLAHELARLIEAAPDQWHIPADPRELVLGLRPPRSARLSPTQ